MPTAWIEKRPTARSARPATASSTRSAAAAPASGTPARSGRGARRRSAGSGSTASSPRSAFPNLTVLAEPELAPTLRRGGRGAGRPRASTSPRRRPCSTAPRSTGCCRSSAHDRIDEIAPAGRRRPRRRAARRREGARDDPQERDRARDGARPRRRHPNPARDRVTVKLPREEPEEPNPPTADARRGGLPAAPVEAPARRCCSSTGRARASRRST